MMQSLLFIPWLVVFANAEQTPITLEIPSALIKLTEQVDVPAREAGVLVEVKVSEGKMVEKDELLAQIMDVETRLAKERAQIEVEIARKKAENDINIRFAKKSAEVSKAEMRRAMESIKKYPKSISDSEMDRLRLTVEQAVLEIEQAERDFEIAKLTLRLEENDCQSAEELLSRRKILAPFSGVVVQINHHRGEWVKPGDMVVRVLRIDRLRAEGFLDAKEVTGDLKGCAVKLTVDLPGERGVVFPGKVVFVSPEIDPVNTQVHVWAEVENRGLRLRPGMRANMSIEVPQTDSTPTP